MLVGLSVLAAQTVWADPSPTQPDDSAVGMGQILTESAWARSSDISHPLPLSGASPAIAKHLRGYIIKPGDTISGIAQIFDIKIVTLKTANGFTNDLLHSGDQLLIPPDDGLLLKTTSNTTLPDIAKRFATSVEQLMVDNGLETPEEVPELIFCYGCSRTAPIANVATSRIQRQRPSDDPLGTRLTVADLNSEWTAEATEGHEFPVGFCTYYVAQKIKITFGGNAINWLGNAKQAGYTTSNTPASGAVVVTQGIGKYAKYGHVAYIEKIEADQLLVSEMNYEGWNQISTRRIPLNSPVIRGYIYPK